MNFEDLHLTQAAAGIRSRSISPVEYTRSLLSRIDKLDPLVNAWVTIDRERALRDAAERESEAQAGHFRGPLHGVPIGVKDIFFTEGLRTAAGSKFLQTFVPDHDAMSVRQLRRAGAIVLGKTVTTEFATFDAGPTRNPWNPNHTPGGSSSGSAAAVAERMCPAATGTQTVGSIGRPAAYCGVVGFMPTQSRVSRAGVFPVSWSLDHVGGFCHSVADARLLLEALSGGVAVLPAFERPQKETVRVGIIRQFFSARMTEDVARLHEQALTRLADVRELVLEETPLPAIFDLHYPLLMTIMRAEIASAHDQYYREHSTAYSPALRALVETGMLVDARTYIRALRLRHIYQRELLRLFERYDVLLTPGAMDTAPEGLGYTGDPGLSGPWSLADFPTLTLPCALAGNGMPVAVQVCAAPLQEQRLFSIGQRLEDIFGFAAKPPDAPAI